MTSRPLALAVSALLAAGLAACSGGSTASTAAGTSAVSAGSTAPGKVGDKVAVKELAARVSAAMKAKRTFHGVMTGGGTGDGEIDYDYGTNDFSLTMQDATGDIAMLKVGDSFYMAGPDMPAGKKWLKVDTKGDDPFAQLLGPVIASLGEATDPLSAMAFDGVDAEVTAADATSTTYVVKLTAAQAQEVAKKMLGSASSDLPLPTESLPAGAMTLTQQVGADGLPQTVTVVTEGEGGGETTMTYSKWGEPLTLAEPPAAEVGSWSDMLGG